MEKISNVISGVNFSQRRQEEEFFGERPVDNATGEIVDLIFDSLVGIFPGVRHVWLTPDVLDSAKYEWAMALMHAKLSDVELIKKGLAACAQLGTPFPPSCGQFIKMCKERNETPAAYAFSLAYKLAGSDSWDHSNPLHQLTYHAWKSSGVSFMRDEILNKAADRLKVFSRNYDIACNMRADGEPLTPIPLALGDPNSVSRAVEVTPVGVAALAAIKAMLV